MYNKGGNLKMTSFPINKKVNKNELMKSFAEGKPLKISIGTGTTEVLIKSITREDNSNQSYIIKGDIRNINTNANFTIPITGWFRTDYIHGYIEKRENNET